MNSHPATEEIQCPYCSFVDSGRFCSRCGKELAAKPASALAEATQTFFKLDDIRRYVSTYWSILRSPTSTTLRLLDDQAYHRHLSFLLTSVTLYVLMASHVRS